MNKKTGLDEKQAQKSPTNHTHKFWKRIVDWEKDMVNRNQVGAKMIKMEIEHRSPFELSIIGKETIESDFKENLAPVSSDLDYAVLYNGKKIAEIDVADSNFAFEQSKCLPAKFYKEMKEKILSVPTYLVYRMNKEHRQIKDQCVWINGENVVKCPHSFAFMGGNHQDNYWTDKADWNRGLDSLIQELQLLSKTSS